MSWNTHNKAKQHQPLCGLDSLAVASFMHGSAPLSHKISNTKSADVAREMGNHPGQIYSCLTQFSMLFKNQFMVSDGTNYSKEELAEIRKLKKEIAELKEERDFFKKRRYTSQKLTNKVCSFASLTLMAYA